MLLIFICGPWKGAGENLQRSGNIQIKFNYNTQWHTKTVVE